MRICRGLLPALLLLAWPGAHGLSALRPLPRFAGPRAMIWRSDRDIRSRDKVNMHHAAQQILCVEGLTTAEKTTRALSTDLNELVPMIHGSLTLYR